jgi:hypothetical protein
MLHAHRYATMLIRSIALAVALALGSAGALAAPGNASSGKGAGIAAYKWVDEHGVTHYGDAVPPQYAQGSSTALNKQGVPITQRSAEKSPDEAAVEAARQQEMMRRQQHDTFLLTTYLSVRDIEALRDERLTQLEGQRQAARQYIDSLRARLFALQKRAGMFRPYSANPEARSMPDDLAEDLARTSEEILRQTDALALKDKEESQVRAQFEGDIQRYNELRPPQLQPQR